MKRWMSVVAVVLVAAGMVACGDNSQLLRARRDIGAMVRVVHGLYAGQSTYKGLSSESLVVAGVVPRNMVSETFEGYSLLNTYGGLVELLDAERCGNIMEDEFCLRYTKVPGSDCVKLAMTADGGRYRMVAVNASVFMPSPLSKREAARWCMDKKNTLTWVFDGVME
ncbi:MAG: type 4 pilus major pilin [Pseudomonadota bacterium]|nr:type 4 pilus major pilin [Pseudomonadota bacterium]